jgi:hypothetical protein
MRSACRVCAGITSEGLPILHARHPGIGWRGERWAVPPCCGAQTRPSLVCAGGWAGQQKGGLGMGRYVVERTFPTGLEIPADESGAKTCLAVVDKNQVVDVSWVHSYVSTITGRRTASTTVRTRRRFAGPPSATACRSTPSPRFRSWIPTSIRGGRSGRYVRGSGKRPPREEPGGL